jgi:hypothetical protein
MKTEKSNENVPNLVNVVSPWKDKTIVPDLSMYVKRERKYNKFELYGWGTFYPVLHLAVLDVVSRHFIKTPRVTRNISTGLGVFTVYRITHNYYNIYTNKIHPWKYIRITPDEQEDYVKNGRKDKSISRI